MSDGINNWLATNGIFNEMEYDTIELIVELANEFEVNGEVIGKLEKSIRNIADKLPNRRIQNSFMRMIERVSDELSKQPIQRVVSQQDVYNKMFYHRHLTHY